MLYSCRIVQKLHTDILFCVDEFSRLNKHQANPYCGEALLKYCKELITQCCKKKQITSVKVRRTVSLAEELIFFLQEGADQKKEKKKS